MEIQKIRVRTLYRNIFVDISNIKSISTNTLNNKLFDLRLKDNSKPFVLNRHNALQLKNSLISKGILLDDSFAN